MKKSFTLLEVTVTTVIILILATLGIVSYRQVLDKTYQKVCATNQMLLLGGVEQYFLDTGVAPATLGDIKPEHLRRAYVEVMKKADWFTKFSYFFVRLNRPKQAFAGIVNLEDLVKPEKMQEYGVPAEVFLCPADRNRGISYGINTNLKNYNKWKDVPADMVIIGDCDSYTFSSPAELAYRHIQNFGMKSITQITTKKAEGEAIGKGEAIGLQNIISPGHGISPEGMMDDEVGEWEHGEYHGEHDE